VYDPKAVRKFVSTDNDINHLREIISILSAAPLPWNASSLSGPLEKIVAMGDKRGAASQILRVAVSGGAVSPPLLETLTLLGKDTTMERLYEFQEMVQAGVPT
jgi:glutamyl-tRNA synthetase